MRSAVQALLFLPLASGYWFVHGRLAVWVLWIPELFDERPFRLAGLLLATIVCGVLAAVIFAWPVLALYRQRGLAAAIAIALTAAIFDAAHVQLAGRLPFTQAALILDVAVFFAALPLCMLVLKRLGATQVLPGQEEPRHAQDVQVRSVDDLVIWNALHDGSIASASGEIPGAVHLLVDIPYLRQLFPGEGTGFSIVLEGCTRLSLEGDDGRVIEGVAEMAQRRPTILSILSESPLVIYTTAGTLRVAYASLTLLLDSGAAVSPSELDAASERYWTEWSAHHKSTP